MTVTPGAAKHPPPSHHDAHPPGLATHMHRASPHGRTLTRRAGDILAYFDHPHTSNGPTEAINGRLEHLRGIAQGFVNHRNYRLRCLLHSGGFQHLLHP